MVKTSERKKELDRERTEWRKTHRSLGGKVILYPKKQPEHVNARGNKTSGFGKKFFFQSICMISLH
jgi:hypothetical protein